MNEIGRKRKELGITQLQAANACGVSLRTYQTYEETDNNNATYQIILQKLDENVYILYKLFHSCYSPLLVKTAVNTNHQPYSLVATCRQLDYLQLV